MSRIVAFSHLRWDFVYQRPQQILSRLATRMPVLFIEEPVVEAGEPWLETIDAAPGVTVLRVHSNAEAAGFHDTHLATMRSLLAPVLGAEAGAVAWFYTPMALPLLADLDASVIVYDCMDDLTGFRHAPRQLAQRERALMQRADLVFTGGPSLYRIKQALHRSVHCFPSSVDAQHFASVGDGGDHPAQASVSRPRLGFFGVIDERFDATLLAAVAVARPDWQIVLVGPVVKVDAATLPRRPNIHYLGMQPYANLPGLVAGWDVCLLPFAHNESTRYISPTKVLEYMAAGKPIVSTAIRDVVEPYGRVVAIADHPADFIEACQRALDESPEAAASRRADMAAIVAATSWDATADAMLGLIDGVSAARPDGSVADVGTVADETASPLGSAPIEIGCAVIGAGPTGLSAGYHLPDSVVFERLDTVGGWCRSIYQNGFTFDHAGHIMFSNDPIVHELYRVLLGDNVHWQNREAWVYSKNVFTRYPFQGALYGLPPAVLKDCLIGAIEARFGAIDGTAKAAPAPAPAARSSRDDDCCGDGEMTRPDLSSCAPAAVVLPLSNAPRNFEEFIYKVWGAGVAKHFAVPYNRKLWTVPLTEMETSWLGGRVPLPDLGEMIEGALEPSKKPVGPNARFGYPLRGGFQALMNGFLPHLEGRLECNADVVGIDLKRHRLTLADGRRYDYDKVISTMPLPKLVALLGDTAPEAVRQAAAGLRHVSIRNVNIGVARENVTEKHWIYYPEDTIFHRVFVQGNTSPHCNPPGGFGLTCEISYSGTKPLPYEGDALIQRCFDDLVRVGLLREDDRILAANEADMEYAYVLYDHARATNVATIRDWLAHYDVLLAGRYSEWEYYNSDHAFLAGRRAALRVQGELPEKQASGAA